MVFIKASSTCPPSERSNLILAPSLELRLSLVPTPAHHPAILQALGILRNIFCTSIRAFP